MYPQLGLRFRGNNKGFREIIATGGAVSGPSAAGEYRYHRFISNGTFTLDVRGTIEYLVVGGGGGGGKGWGGAAGGVLTGEQFLEAGTYSVVIGSGGRGATGRPVFSNNRTLPSVSGGYSSFNSTSRSNGGSGGDQGGQSGNGYVRGTAIGGGGGGGSGQVGSGYKGGNGTYLPDWASATGTGVSGWYAGGGGGSGGTAARGQRGGGGAGGGGYGGLTVGENDNFWPTAAVARTGSGGGAGFGGYENRHIAGAYGASGLVIVRYRIYKP